MKVTIAKNAGFCFGVKRAVDEAIKHEGSFTLGPLIHNPQTIKELEKQGIRAVDSVDDIDGGTLIIRTHGVPEAVIQEAKEKGLNVIDLTCPFVKKAQDYAKKFYTDGYKVVIIGEANHPEVVGIMGNIKDAVVVENPDEVKEIGIHDKIGVVIQTTQSKDNVARIINKLRDNSKEIKIADTICHATIERQDFAKELAKNVDLMIVIGGKESANTKRVYNICKNIVDSARIEKAEDLEKEWFKNKGSVGVTAGASTPKWLIKKIATKIENEF